MASMVTCNVHVVPDATRPWVTIESNNPYATTVISFWYNPSSVLTMGDVVETIERTFGSSACCGLIDSVTVRGLVIKRKDLDNHNAADLLKDGEAFNCYVVRYCCTLL